MAIQPRYYSKPDPDTGKNEPIYEMTLGKVKLDKNGKPRRKVRNYKVEVYRTDPVTKKQQRKVVGTYTKWEDADRANRAAKVAIEKGTYEWDGPSQLIPTIAEAVALWLDTKGMQVTANTLNGYRNAADKYVIPAWRDTPVDEITYAEVQRQVNQWKAGGKGAQTMNRAVLVLRGALDLQLRSGTIRANPALGVVKPSVNQHKEVLIWTDPQLQRFLDAARSHQLSPLWFLLALEGMRRSEALALRWADIQWHSEDGQATATVQRTLVPDLNNGGKALIQSRTKTKGSRRSLMLTPQTTAVLREHLDRQRFQKKELGDEWRADDTIVTTSIGTHVNPTSVKSQLANLIERCNLIDPSQIADGRTRKSERQYLPEDQRLPQITTHTLRHMAATKMLQGGAPLQVVQARLGHADVRMTADRYGHLEVKDQKVAVEAMSRAAGGLGVKS